MFCWWKRIGKYKVKAGITNVEILELFDETKEEDASDAEATVEPPETLTPSERWAFVETLWLSCTKDIQKDQGNEIYLFVHFDCL